MGSSKRFRTKQANRVVDESAPVNAATQTVNGDNEVAALKNQFLTVTNHRLRELTEDFRLEEYLARPTDIQRSLEELRADLAEVPVVGKDGHVIDVFSKIEQEASLTSVDKELIWLCLATVREAFRKADSDGTRAAETGYQWNMNWKHTRAEIDQVLESARLLCLSGIETRDAILASIFSDSVKNRGNFITHNLDGAVGACQVMSYFVDVSRSQDFQSIERIVQAVKEHQIAPPEFMAHAVAVLISKKRNLKWRRPELSGAWESDRVSADELSIREIYRKISDPFNERNLNSSCDLIAFTERERTLLAEISIKEWYVPHPRNHASRVAHAVIAGDHSINYNHPEGFAKIALIRGPDTEAIFEDPTIHHSLDSAMSSFMDSFRVLLPEVQPMAIDGLRRTKTAVERVIAIMRELFCGITYGAPAECRETGADKVSSAVERAHSRQPELFKLEHCRVSQESIRYSEQAIARVALILENWLESSGEIPFNPKESRNSEPGSAKLPFWNAPLKYPPRDNEGIVNLSSLSELELRQFQFAEKVREIAVELLRAEQWIF